LKYKNKILHKETFSQQYYQTPTFFDMSRQGSGNDYNAIINYGMSYGMAETTRKITIHVPEDLLAAAQDETGEGVTQTVRRGLELLRRARAYRELAKLRGKIRFEMTADELRGEE
jgi:hypothetical protein